MTSQEAQTYESGLIQIIHPPEEPGGTIPLEFWDCSDSWKSFGFNSAADAIAAIGGHASTPFDMGVEMARSLLVKLPNEIGVPSKYLIMITIHHAISDGGSHRIVLHDLLRAYRAYADYAEEPTGLPHLPLEYADYAMWQQQYLEIGDHLEQQLEYWTKQLSNMPVLLNLPFDRPHPEMSSDCEGSYLPVFLPGKLVARLADLCTQHRSTIFVGLMAAFQLSLSRLAGDVEDLVVGTPNTSRDDIQLHDMVGCILDMLAIRGDLKGYPSFSTLLERQRLVMTDALQHANIPFSWIVQRLQVPRIAGCHPVYQVGIFV